MVNFPLVYILFLVFCLSALVSILLVLVFPLRLSIYKRVQQKDEVDKPPVSMIICAQNEYRNLLELLPLLFEQDYPEFEVILVDDGSTDDTTFLLQDFVKSEPRLHIIELTESVKNKQGKKFALMMGLKGAKYDHVLLTDADCRPASKLWIQKMVRGFSKEKEIVLGFSPYQKYGGFLNLFIRFETFMTASNYFSFALAKVPYMGVGRNLSYHKHLFFDNKGFSSHIHLMSGDDDLFINQVANSSNTAIELDPDTFVYSKPKRSFSDYLHQKTRHLSVGKFYKPLHKNLLTLPIVFNFIVFLSFTVLMVLHQYFLVSVGIFSFYILLVWIIYYSISRKLRDPILGIAFPFLWILYHLYLLGMSFSGLFYKAKTWK